MHGTTLRALLSACLCAALLGAFGADVAGAQETTDTTSTTPSSSSSRATYTTTDDLNDVRPFLGWVHDAVFTEGIDLEPTLNWADVSGGNLLFAGTRAAFWLMEGLELGGKLGFVSFDPERFDAESGLSDLGVYGRYALQSSNPRLAVGASMELPIGSEDAGQGTFDFDAFAAMRYRVDTGLEILGNVGIQSLDRGDRDNGILLGGGIIQPLTEEAALIAELSIATAGEYAALSGGVDYELPPGGHLRGALALGLDDGAPDVELILSFAIPVY